MRTQFVLIFSVVFLLAGAASADTFDVTVDTGSISGDPGSIDFQFNPGSLVTEPATLDITDFTSDGMLLPASPNNAVIGDATGMLPGTLTISNTDADNEYFEDFDFGSTLSFDVTVPATLGGTSGSVFVFSLFSDPLGTVPVLTNDPNGIVLLENVNADGSISTTDVSPQLTSAEVPVATPEPRTLLLLGPGLFTLVLFRKRLSRRSLMALR